jgi:hypothetical protein
MPDDRPSIPTFLSLCRRDPLGDCQPRHSDPRDCVLRSPSANDEMTQLTGFDLHGVVRVKIEVADRDSGWWEALMIRYMRWRFGRPLRVIR